MENYWKNFGKIIVIILSIFFTQIITPNTNAITFSQPVKATGNMWVVGDKGRLQLLDNSILSADQYGKVNIPQYPANYANIRGIYRDGNIDVQEGYYYTFIIGSRTSASNTAFIWRNLWNESSDFSVVGVEDIDTSAMTLYDFCVKFRVSNSVYQCEQASADQFSHVTKLAQVWMRANVTGSRQFRFGGSTNGNLIQVLAPDFLIGDIFEYNPNSEQEEAEQKTEEASEEGQNNSDSAQSDNEGATSSLLDVAGGIISAFATSPSNCNFNMDLGNVDFGNMNLCSGKPSEFSPIIDTVIILMLIPIIFMTSISLVHQFINLTKFAQGGD